MMKRVLMCLLFCSIGILPAAAAARQHDRDRGGDPRGDSRGDMRDDPRGSEFGARRDFDRPLPPVFEDRGRRRPDQDRARDAMREGARPLRDIQQQWRQGMPGYDYIGSDYDAGSGSYRLKFLRGGAVSWVEVDGRTGREIGRSPR
jgi:hypothetical protein